MVKPHLQQAAGRTKHRNPYRGCLLVTGFLCFGSADLRSHEALTGLRVSADLQKQICLRKSAEPIYASIRAPISSKEMYIQEVSIEIKTKVNQDQIVEEFDLLMSFYRGSGQTQGKIESQYIKDKKIVGFPFTLEKNSLNSKNNNFYVNRQTKKLEELSGSKLKIETKGPNYQSYKSPCTCIKSEYYILITNYLTILSPIECGSCNKTVPLYKLPIYYDYGYRPILSWESNYIACDTLQMNCEVGEKWALNQMEKLSSTLTKQGRKICTKIEELSGIPTFYYLHNYNQHKGDTLKRTCPSCNQKWSLKEGEHKMFDFKCNKCRLISILSPNSN